MLRKDQRGKWDQKPEEIVYVREIILGAREKTGGAGAGGG
jgi:hypothetical protein